MRFALFLPFLFLAGCGSKGGSEVVAANVDRSGKAEIRLELKPKKGDHYRYEMVTDMEAVGAEGKVHWTMTMDETATNAGADSSTWEQKLSNAKVSANGSFKGMEEIAARMEGMKISLTYDMQGQQVATSVPGSGGGTSNLIFPKGAVKPGDKWPAEIEVNGQKVKIEYTYVGKLTERGQPAALVHGNLIEGQIIKSLKPTKFVVEIATGKPYKVDGEYEVKSPANLKMKFLITRS